MYSVKPPHIFAFFSNFVWLNCDHFQLWASQDTNSNINNIAPVDLNCGIYLNNENLQHTSL